MCEYRPYNCPCPGNKCKWQGNLDDVIEHLLSEHKVKFNKKFPSKKIFRIEAHQGEFFLFRQSPGLKVQPLFSWQQMLIILGQ